MGLIEQLHFRPGPGERIETSLTLPEPDQASFYARLLRADGSPAAGVLALLFESPEGPPLQGAVSDEAGRICFGPLPPDRLYTLCLQLPCPEPRLLEVPL